MSNRSRIVSVQLATSLLTFTLIAGCGSSGGKSSDGGGGSGGAAAGAGGSTAGAGGSTAGAGGSSVAGAGGSTAGTGGSGTDASAGTSGSDASAGADGSVADGAAGATSDGAAGAGGSDAGTCPMIANIATTFADTSASGPVPVGTGGAISDGTYTMTGNVVYMSGSTNGKTHTYTFKITGTTMAVTGRDSEDNGDGSAGFTLTANPATGALSIIGFCPPGYVGKNLGNLDSYTATATVIHAYASTKQNEVVLTKQ